MEDTTLIRLPAEDLELEVAVRHAQWFTDIGFEPLSTAVFRHAAGLSDVIVDIGAHVGWYSLAAVGANPTAQVVAVEASPDNHAVLQRNLQRNGASHVTALQAALSSACGSVDIHLTEASDNCGIHGHVNSPTVEVTRVAMIDGSALGITRGHNLLLKVDIEGAEMSALEGLERVFDDAATVRLLLEFNPRCLALAGHSDPTVMLSWLFERGFEVFAVDDREFHWRRVSQADRWDQFVARDSYVNLYCVRGAEVAAVTAILHSGAQGGAELSFAENSAAMLRRGHLIQAIRPTEPGQQELERTLVAAGIPVTTAPYGWWASAAAGADWRASCRGLAQVEAELTLSNPTVVLSWTSVVPVGALAAARLGIPHVWSIHEFLDRDHALRAPLPARDLGAEILSMSHTVLTNSQAVADHLFGDAAAVVVRPPLVLDPTTATPDPRPLSDVPVVGIFAAVAEAKGHADLIRAAGILRERGRDVVVRIHGSAAPQQIDDLQDLAAGAGVAVEFAGQVDDVDAAMRDIDVAAVPSWLEGFGRVPFEAARSGTPVVYADVGGVSEYMLDGVTGIACSPQDPRSLADAIEQILADDTLRARLQVGAWQTLAQWWVEQDGVAALEGALLAAGAQSRRPDPARRSALWQQLELGAAIAFLRDSRDTAAALARTRRDLAQMTAAREEAADAARHAASAAAAARADEAHRLRTMVALEREVAVMTDSRSWRLTSPLRRLRRRLDPRR